MFPVCKGEKLLYPVAPPERQVKCLSKLYYFTLLVGLAVVQFLMMFIIKDLILSCSIGKLATSFKVILLCVY